MMMASSKNVLSQTDMQEKLEDIEEQSGFEAALETLYQWSIEQGYLDPAFLSKNQQFSFHDKALCIDFKAQINPRRGEYLGNPDILKPAKNIHCAICFDNVTKDGNSTLRAYSVSLSDKRQYFIQLSLYPVYPDHFVVVDHETRPMSVSRQSFTDLVNFVERAPDYTTCSNSDVDGIGASILEHHHFHAVKELHLPIMDAAWHGDYFERTNVLGYTLSWGFLNYPMATIKLRCRNAHAFIQSAAEIIREWKSKDPGKNTVSLIVHLDEKQHWVGYLIFRSPEHKTPETLGVFDVAGEVIYFDKKAKEKLKKDGLQTIETVLQGNNPLPESEWYATFRSFIPSIRSLTL